MDEITAAKVYEEVLKFFEQEAGNIDRESHDCGPEAGKHNVAKVGASNPCLLEIACMGNAEKTIQGELFHYLRNKGIVAVLEASYAANLVSANGNSRRSIDIMVFDDSSPRKPIVAIELKHHDPHQGAQPQTSIAPLCKGLNADYNKRPKSGKVVPVPLIQVGLFTGVTSISPTPFNPPNSNPPVDFLFHRFISYYVITLCQKTVTFKKIKDCSDFFGLWLDLGSALSLAPHYKKQSGGLIIGAHQTFKVPNSGGNTYTVEGHVSYFIGLVN